MNNLDYLLEEFNRVSVSIIAQEIQKILEVNTREPCKEEKLMVLMNNYKNF